MTEVLSPISPLSPTGLASAGQCIDQAHPEFFRGLHESGEAAAAGMDMMDVAWLEARGPRDDINDAYQRQVNEPGFSHYAFAKEFFDPPIRTRSEHIPYQGGDRDEHAHKVLMALTGVAMDTATTHGSPNPVVESGGRYSDGRLGHAKWWLWDMLPIVGGLDALGEHELATGQIDNIRDQIERFGHSLNGNSWEYLGRGQPDILARLVRRDVRREGSQAWERHLPALEAEYGWRMDGADDPAKLGKEPGSRYKSVARMPDGSVASGFSAEDFTHPDGTPRPRPEAYPADMATRRRLETLLGHDLDISEWTQLSEELHTGAGAGTDYASWMLGDVTKYVGWMPGDGIDLATIRVTRRIPPFQNALMFELECTIAEGCHAMGRHADALIFEERAAKRAHMMNTFLWDEKLGYYLPYDLDTGPVQDPTLQDGAFMLESGATPKNRQPLVRQFWRKNFLDEGGLWTSTNNTPLSWTGDNSWLILNESAVRGAWYSGGYRMEKDIRNAAENSVTKGVQDTGFTFERYDATNPGQPGKRGGEYDVPEHNFAWSVAVDATFRNRTYRDRTELIAWYQRQRIATAAGYAVLHR